MVYGRYSRICNCCLCYYSLSPTPGRQNDPEFKWKATTSWKLSGRLFRLFCLSFLVFRQLTLYLVLPKITPKIRMRLQVKVTAHQYWWEFEYPKLGIKTAQELIIPNDDSHFD